MIKLLGSLLVFGGGLMLRSIRLHERCRRMEALSDVICVLRRMAEEIRMARTPFPVLLERLSADCGADAKAFFQSAARAAQGDDFAEKWKAEAAKLPLAPKARRELTSLGGTLHGDEESICKAISLVTYELSGHCAKMQEERRMEEQRTTALCLSSAALLVILLI